MEEPAREAHDGDFLLRPPDRVENDLSGNVTGPVVQAGVIHHVTFAYPAPPHPAAVEAAPAPDDGPTGLDILGATVPRTPEELAELRAARPNAWEYLLYAGELYVGLRRLEPKALDHRLGHRVSGRVIPDQQAAITCLGDAFAEARRISDDVDRWMSQEAQERAFGRPGEPGDPELIAHIAGRLLNSQEALMDWAMDLRSARPPAHMRRMFELASRYVDASVDSFRAFVETLVTQTDQASATLARRDGSVAHIEVTYSMTIAPEVVAEFEAEQDRVAGKRKRPRRR